MLRTPRLVVLTLLTLVSAAPYAPAAGCDKALNDYCNGGGCDICGENVKYARLDFGAANEKATARWRCYCDYTLSSDLQSWVNKRVDHPKRSAYDYCTRHLQLEKRLTLCKEGTTTVAGDEVKEL